MDFRTWYDALLKPAWTPSPATISLIWQFLYPIIFVSFGFVFYKAIRGKIGKVKPGEVHRGLSWRVILPFLVNLAANFLFMPIFGGLRSLPLAAVDVLLVLATIPWCMWVIWPHYRWVTLAQVPYLVWVSIASVLQVMITIGNW